MPAQDGVTIVRKLFDGFNNHDLDQAVADVADEFELVDIAAGMTFRGKDGCRQWLQGFLTGLPDAHAEITNVAEAGDWVFSEHTGRGTHTGPLMSPAGAIPPTNRSIELRFAEVFKVEGGRLTCL